MNKLAKELLNQAFQARDIALSTHDEESEQAFDMMGDCLMDMVTEMVRYFDLDLADKAIEIVMHSVDADEAEITIDLLLNKNRI